MKFRKITNFFLLFLCMCFSLSVLAQQKNITGRVTDSDNLPLVGVHISVKGTNTAATTNIDGKFTINAASESTLVFSYVGKETQDLKVGSKSAFDVVLKDNSLLLNETVVIGYGSAKKRDLTGSITNIKASDLANRPTSNPISSLQGKVPGVQIVNSGRAGADPDIRVRGTNSINGYKPLYVIDGLFTDNVSYLNPEDIESMEILKDPSSLAIFGVRGANGVIIISTKRAKEGQTIVNINSSIGWKTVPDKISMVNAAQFKELYNEQLTNQGTATFDFSKWTADTDWQDQIFQTGFITNNNISITSSTGKHRSYFSLGYSNEGGNIKHEKFNKITVNLSSDYNLTKDIKVGFQFNGARMLPTDGKEVLNAVRSAPVGSVYNDEFGLYSVLPPFQKAQISNPMVDVELKANRTKNENYRGSGNFYGEVKFLKNFTFKTIYSMDYSSYNSRTYTPIVKLYDADATGSVTTVGTGKTAVSQYKQNERKFQSDYLLTYTNKFGNHNVTGTAGFTTFYNALERLDAARQQGDGLVIADNSDKWFVSIGDAGTSTNGSTQWERSTVSALARVLYNYNGKYLINASFRRDGSSAFSYTNKTWQNFYSAGGGWLMSEEDFLKDVKWLNSLKLKGSWGTLGNQNLDTAYPADPILENKSSAVFGTNIIPGYQLAYLPNPTLRWEKVEAWEAGFESKFLNSRLQFDAVYYKKNTKDLLAKVPGLSGTVPGIGNLGEIQNKGIELSLDWNDKIGDLGYHIGGNVSTIKNKVLSLVQEGYAIIDGDKSQSYTQSGYPIGYFYGYKVEGVYQSASEIANSPVNTLATVTPGDLKFVDLDHDNKITPLDRTMIGNPTPKFIYGINLGLNYKSVELNVEMMGQGGNQIYRTWDNYNWSQFNFMSQRLGRWHGEGTSNSQPLLNTKHTINNLNSEYYIEKGDFFRIRNIQLAYNFNKQLLNKLHISNLKIYTNIQNLKTWKHNTGYTPELGGSATAFGVDNGSYPMPAIYTMGINLTF